MSDRSVAGKVGIKYCVHTLILAPPMFSVELVLLPLIQQKMVHLVFESGA